MEDGSDSTNDVRDGAAESGSYEDGDDDDASPPRDVEAFVQVQKRKQALPLDEDPSGGPQDDADDIRPNFAMHAFMEDGSDSTNDEQDGAAESGSDDDGDDDGASPPRDVEAFLQVQGG